MTAPTKEKLAEKLAKAIHEGIASPLFRARERALGVFRGLRITPTVTIDPEDASVSFGFEPGRAPADVDATLERLLDAARRARAGAQARRRARARRVPGGRRDRPGPPEAHARGVPGAARGGARLPRLEAAHDARDLQRRERAVLAERQAARARRDPRPTSSRRSSPSASRRPASGSTTRPSRRDPRGDRGAPVRDAGALLLHLGGDRPARDGDAAARARRARGRPALRARALLAHLGRRVGGAAAPGRGARAPSRAARTARTTAGATACRRRRTSRRRSRRSRGASWSRSARTAPTRSSSRSSPSGSRGRSEHRRALIRAARR